MVAKTSGDAWNRHPIVLTRVFKTGGDMKAAAISKLAAADAIPIALGFSVDIRTSVQTLKTVGSV